jgi:putative Mg2+ transporter-C (MgtC) family protein
VRAELADLLEIAGKVGLAALLAGLVGAEREKTGKWAGLRTHMLIAVGAALLTDVSIQIGTVHHGTSAAWDPGRIAAQIVSGVGFLGAGTIIQSRGTVRGLTTAAGLWVAAAIGLAVGASFYIEATVTALALLLILVALKPVERRLLDHTRSRLLAVAPGHRLEDLVELIDETGVEVRSLQPRRGPEGLTVLVRYQASEAEEAVLVERLEREGSIRTLDDG